jgi:hypothetical protein
MSEPKLSLRVLICHGCDYLHQALHDYLRPPLDSRDSVAVVDATQNNWTIRAAFGDRRIRPCKLKEHVNS